MDCRGIEPRFSDCKSNVLPLDQQPVYLTHSFWDMKSIAGSGIEPDGRPYESQIGTSRPASKNSTHPCPALFLRRLYLAKGNSPSTAGFLLTRRCLRRSCLRLLGGFGVFENSYCDRVHDASWLAESNVCSLPLANRIENRFSVIGFSNKFLCAKCC